MFCGAHIQINLPIVRHLPALLLSDFCVLLSWQRYVGGGRRADIARCTGGCRLLATAVHVS